MEKMTRARVGIVALAALGLGGGLLWSVLGLPAARPAAAEPGAAELAAARAAAPSTATLESQPAASAQRAPASEQTAARPARRQQADAVRAKLRRELAGRIRHSGAAAAPGRPGSRAAPSSPAAAGEPAAPPRMPALEGTGNQADRPLGKYVRETLQQQFIPLAGSCYEQLLQRQPQASGKLVLDLEIVGDGSVGGVVNDVTLGEGTTLDDEELATCVSESLYSTVFDAPPDDEKSVTVSYPLELSP